MTIDTRPPPPAWKTLWRGMLEREPSQRPRWQRWGFAVLVTLLALWLRLWIGSPASGGRFATLGLACILATWVGGFSSGLISTVLGLVLANFFLVEPYGEWAFSNPQEGLWLNLIFLCTQLAIAGAIAVMQGRNRHLHQTARDLNISRERYLNTFEHAAAGITRVGLQGELMEVNQTFCDMVGYSKEALLAMDFLQVTLPDDLERNLKLFQETLAGKHDQYTIEKRYRHRLGHVIWGQVTVALVRTAEGAPDYLIAVVQNVSQQKATEASLRRSERLMQQAQAVAGFITWEADIAQQRFRSFGHDMSKVDFPGSEFGIEQVLWRTHPDDAEKLTQEWTQAIKGRGHFVGTYRGRPGSPVRWYFVRADFERDADGRAVRAFGITQDISARKETKLEVQRLNASLEQRIQERTLELKRAYGELESYSYAVAHDLRSPLRIINGFAQALEEDNPGLEESSLIHIHRIKSSSRKMGLLIDGLLQLSKFARGDIHRQPINLSFIATRLMHDLQQTQPERRVEWTIEPNLHTEADPALIEALLQNLLSNAWKYTEQTPQAKIHFCQQLIDGERRYCVSDNGAGFDMARADKLFQPFQRLHMPHEFDGLGVGLATARRIVQRHGGELHAQGKPGEGARFCFTLPAPASA